MLIQARPRSLAQLAGDELPGYPADPVNSGVHRVTGEIRGLELGWYL